MAQAVHVDVSEHATKILSELHRMRQSCKHCDFIIKVGNDVYRTHRNVLCAGSEYFRAMLEHDTKESRDGVITFKDVDSECVKNCIDFIYSGKFEIPNEKMKDLLHIGIMLQLDGVKTATAEILAESINVENYYWTANIADMYELADVLTTCQRFFKENLMEIANQPEFENMPLSILDDFLLSEDSKYSGEEKLTIYLRWGEKNPKMNSNLLESIQRFKLETVSSTFLINLLKANSVVSNDLMIYKFLNIHLIENLEKKNKSNEGATSQESTPISMNSGNTGDDMKVEDKPSRPKNPGTPYVWETRQPRKPRHQLMNQSPPLLFDPRPRLLNDLSSPTAHFPSASPRGTPSSYHLPIPSPYIPSGRGRGNGRGRGRGRVRRIDRGRGTPSGSFPQDLYCSPGGFGDDTRGAEVNYSTSDSYSDSDY